LTPDSRRRPAAQDRIAAWRDYTWCKFAAQRGWSIDEIAAELPNVSEKASQRIALHAAIETLRTQPLLDMQKLLFKTFQFMSYLEYTIRKVGQHG
jgi:hypothetical protein